MIKRKMTSAFAVAAMMGVATAFAVNPFSDVPSDSWAYQAVDQLATAGIINGYPDGTFKGQNNITRYEMAQMIAKGMANQDRANAERNGGEVLACSASRQAASVPAAGLVGTCYWQGRDTCCLRDR